MVYSEIMTNGAIIQMARMVGITRLYQTAKEEIGRQFDFFFQEMVNACIAYTRNAGKKVFKKGDVLAPSFNLVDYFGFTYSEIIKHYPDLHDAFLGAGKDIENSTYDAFLKAIPSAVHYIEQLIESKGSDIIFEDEAVILILEATIYKILSTLRSASRVMNYARRITLNADDILLSQDICYAGFGPSKSPPKPPRKYKR